LRLHIWRLAFASIAIGAVSLAVAACFPSFGFDAADASSRPPAPDARPPVLRGVTTDDFTYTAGYGGGVGPTPSPIVTYRYLFNRGIRLIRLPFLWGNPTTDKPTGIQPALQGPLDSTCLSRLQTEVQTIQAAGLRVVLVLDSSFRFPVRWNGNLVTQADFNSIWLLLSQVFKDNSAVYAYDLQNGPSSDDDSYVISMMQGAVTALRAAGDNKLLWIQGNNGGNPNWLAAQSPTWIKDPAGNFAYEAHGSPDYAWLNEPVPPAQNQTAYDAGAVATFQSGMQAFHDWCVGSNLRCAVGEIGWPGENTSADWAMFNSAMEKAYELFDDARMDVTYFGVGGAINDILWAYSAAEPGVDTNVVPGSISPISQAQTQSLVIERHPGFP
jgi:hypothetical protein